MRDLLVRLHRWFGLFAAVFLFVAGATGAVIAWDHEIDSWLNPQLYRAQSGQSQPAASLPAIELARRVETMDPHVRVTYMPLAVRPGQTFVVQVAPRQDPATGQPFQVAYNQLALDPVTGHVQGRRLWGELRLSRENVLPFLYKLHYSLHIPEAWGIEAGILFMGMLAMVWVLDTAIALWISFPNWRQWRRSFMFRWSAGGHRLTFDLHRSGALWVYPLVLMLAVTSVSMNLREQVMRPVVSWFSKLSPSPLAGRSTSSPLIEPAVSSLQAVETARQEAQRRTLQAPAGALWYSAELGLWGIGFFEPGHDHADGSLGNPWIYVDASHGHIVGADMPGVGSAGDIFLQSMFPLHSGRILGTLGRVIVSSMGALIAMLSVTGVLLWVRKHHARQLRDAPRKQGQRQRRRQGI